MTANNMGAKELTEGLGQAIRKRRKLLGMRLIDVAETADVSQAFLSQIENGAAASLFTHHRIAVALETTLHSLLEIAASPPVSVVRRDEGDWLRLFDGASVRILVGGPGHSLEANETVASPGAAMVEPFVHVGEDLAIVLEGTFVFKVGDEDPVVLQAGDVLSYPSELPHLFRVEGDVQARLIVVNTPGSLLTGLD